MAEVAKLLYIVVVDEGEKREKGKASFRYTRSVLQSTLQLMGCKPRHAFKISRRVFELRNELSADALLAEGTEVSSGADTREHFDKGGGAFSRSSVVNNEVDNHVNKEKCDRSKKIPFELYKRRTTVVVRRETFLDVVCSALSEYKYVGPNQRADLVLACRIRERKESVTVLLCGTSGCGKSTLSALLGSRLGITTVVSTDSIRHMMRSFADEKQNPLLWASTYHAGECLDPVAVAEAKAKRKAKKRAGITSIPKDEVLEGSKIEKSDTQSSEVVSASTEMISPKQMAIEGFKAQSEMVIDSLDRLITAWEERKESVVVEGVHLSLNFVMGLMKKHPSIIPFMIYITSEDKHMERFAVRAKYMTLDPAKNKYVKYIRNIRTIQDYLTKRADKHLVPKVNNTNVDRSVAAIHATVFSCLRRREAGEPLYDYATNTVSVVDEEYRNQCAANSSSSKGMFQLIQRKGSSRHLMALLNTDGSVAKAWPVNSVDGNGTESGIGTPWYGPLQIGKAEPVNIPFGHFGISAWPSDGGTSHAGSVDESRADGTDTGSRYYSSCCSSPRISDGPAKELKEEQSVHGSDEEVDDPLEPDTDDDISDDERKQLHEEVGSVDEESTKSDEEYDDLAMLDVQESGYWSDDDEEMMERQVPNPMSRSDTKYSENLERFLRTRNSEQLSEPLCSYSSLLMEKNGDRTLLPPPGKMKKRSLSIPAFRKQGSVIGDPILSGAPQS
ncbi:P-loop NTPase domain-containing protein LPA1 homolog 1-like [Punica granatum]|uniref:Uncharacterized protein n=2 Tax=Punica granatum TaxID=22663 RepID=A0A218WMA7_PUNGR|nr:P-loop NTPase domain-containing protein LPA1 homolog 1-like [Punica granatum]OWM73776.1 hypothetical protein CDL15_Pgr026880 [Punica granatum]PKI64401.1 hypothetical protein CRG98_015186 [Punica granatum]